MTTPIIPFWVKLRQCKVEPQGDDNTLKVTGPNLRDAYLFIRPAANNRWEAGLRLDPAGPDVATAEVEDPHPKEAWDTAFELYRTNVVI